MGVGKCGRVGVAPHAMVGGPRVLFFVLLFGTNTHTVHTQHKKLPIGGSVRGAC
jgi:hypothetical protein